MTWHDIIRLHVASARGRSDMAVVPPQWCQVPELLQSMVRLMKVVLDEQFPVEIVPGWLGLECLLLQVGGEGIVSVWEGRLANVCRLLHWRG